MFGRATIRLGIGPHSSLSRTCAKTKIAKLHVSFVTLKFNVAHTIDIKKLSSS